MGLNDFHTFRTFAGARSTVGVASGVITLPTPDGFSRPPVRVRLSRPAADTGIVFVRESGTATTSDKRILPGAVEIEINVRGTTFSAIADLAAQNLDVTAYYT